MDFRPHKGAKGVLVRLLAPALCFASMSCVSLPQNQSLLAASPAPVEPSPPETPPDGGSPIVASSALRALQQGDFDGASAQAARELSVDPGNPHALLVQAVTRYKRAAQRLSTQGRTTILRGLDRGQLDQRTVDEALGEAEAQLAQVDRELEPLAQRKDLAVELCLACWEIDWNGNGRIDRGDRLLMQIEQDAQGNEIAEDDPRRKPTFRFDHGDVLWAQAFVSFQRAALDLGLAYDWGALAQSLGGRQRDLPPKVVVRLARPERVAAARAQILRGLSLSDASRVAYLAETDDDREWVPNPRQRSHPMPLPVDGQLYATWEAVVGDARRLLQGDEGLALSELLSLAGERWEGPPAASLQVGRMLSSPRDLVLDVEAIEALKHGRGGGQAQLWDRVAAGLFGAGYGSGGKPSPLPGRLLRMQREVDRGDEPLERKLRYLFWLN